jgi:sporulation integral membrane protein YlbJ
MRLSKSILFRIRNIIPKGCLTAVGVYAALRYPQECAKGIGDGISFCTGVLVPSLFFFMALTAYLIKSGIASVLSRPLAWLSMKLFRLPGESMTAVLLAMLGGYPIGAGCAAMLMDEGRLSESEAVKTSYIAVAAGPGFLINYIGTALLGNPAVGEVLLAAQAVAILLTGILIGYTVKTEPPLQRVHGVVRNSGNTLVEAIRSAGYATFTMCSTVLLFSAVTEILRTIFTEETAAILAGICEVTTGSSLLSSHGASLPLIAFFIGFGGLSVHCQIYAILNQLAVNRRLFFFYRIIEGIITALCTYSILMIFPIEAAVFNSTDAPLTAGRSATIAGSGALILASICFVGTVSEYSLRKLRR